jgi:molybdopterin-synthase adenylyltransferase
MSLDRYHRQMLLAGIGKPGQEKLRDSHALVVGCGALGSVIIDSLARAGVGKLAIIDRDIIEITNLQRQILYDEKDVAEGMPKAEAAKRRIGQINSEVQVDAHVDDFSHRNADRFIEGIDVILDGLDNFETRYVLNDIAVMRGLPYIYGGAVGTTGVSLSILPHPRKRERESTSRVKWTAEQSTPCLRCVFPDAPPPGTTPTCDTAGVLGPIVSIIASHQAAQAIKLLTGNINALDRSLLSLDLWDNQWRHFDVSEARDASNCPCCAQGNFEHFQGSPASMTTAMCGRHAVQITPIGNGEIDLAQFITQLAPHGEFTHNEFLLRGEFRNERGDNGQPIELTLFPNGRAIVKGTHEPEVARTIYAKYVGA